MDIKKVNAILQRMETSLNKAYIHSERTAMLCYAAGKELKLSYAELEQVYFAGLLHEIGLLDTPCIMEVKGKGEMVSLDSQKIYPYFSASILNNIEDFEIISDIIIQHQENVDGSGYPNGLKGDDIDLLAKILRISDFYDTQRANGIKHDDTTKLIRQNSEIIFPNKIITPFIKSVIKNELQFEYGEN